MPEGGQGRRYRKNIYVIDIIDYIYIMACGFKMQPRQRRVQAVATKPHSSEKRLGGLQRPGQQLSISL
jgi:hypothetical protein